MGLEILEGSLSSKEKVTQWFYVVETPMMCSDYARGRFKDVDGQLNKLCPKMLIITIHSRPIPKIFQRFFSASLKQLETEKDYRNIYSRHKLACKLKVL